MSKVIPSRGVIVSAKSSGRVHVSEFSRENLSASVSRVPNDNILISYTSHLLFRIFIFIFLRSLPATRDVRVDSE